MIHKSWLPKFLWGEAISHMVWLKNQTSTRVIGHTTPFKWLYCLKPNLAGVPEWGQVVWVHHNTGNKLNMHVEDTNWVSYDQNSTHAHRIYWPSCRIITVEQNLKFTDLTTTIQVPDTITTPSAIPAPSISAPVLLPPPAPPIILPAVPISALAAVSPASPSAQLSPDTQTRPSYLTPMVASKRKLTILVPPYAPKKPTSEPEQPHQSSWISKPTTKIKQILTSEGTSTGISLTASTTWFRGMHPDFTGELRGSSNDLDVIDHAYCTDFVQIILSIAEDNIDDQKTLQEAQE